MNKAIQQFIAEHDGSDPLNEEDYAILKGIVVGTGRIDLAELGYLLRNNPTALLDVLARFSRFSRKPTPGYEVDLTSFQDVDDFIAQVRSAAQNRVPPLKSRSRTAHFYNSHPVFFLLLFLIVVFIEGVFQFSNTIFLYTIIPLISCLFLPLILSEFYSRKALSLKNAFQKGIHFLETHENFATLRELGVAANVSRNLIIEAITTLGLGDRRQSTTYAIGSLGRLNKGIDAKLRAKLPLEEVLHFLPPVDGVMRVPMFQPSRLIEQTKLSTIWGMLLVEKRIDQCN